MPSLGADMESGVLLEWLVEPGAQVHRGDIVAVVDTDKAEIEIESFEDGTIDDLMEPGARVPVGERIATITVDPTSGSQPDPAPVPAPTPAQPVKSVVPTPTPAPSPPAPVAAAPRVVLPHHERPRVSPLARRAAEARHVDLTHLEGTGYDHAIVLADVERADADSRIPTTEPATSALAGAAAPDGHAATMREATAALMARSKREIPHFSVETTIDLANAMAWLESHNAGRPAAERVLPAALLLAATARAARDVPELNAHFEGGRVKPATAVHVGVAIALRGGGLIAPAILDADRSSVDETMERLRDVATRAKRGVMRASEMTQATITVTNLGDRGADKVLGVIYPPQVAIVGLGAIRDRVTAVDGMIAVRPSVIATVAADHRVTDGHQASRFLAALDHHLQTPELF